MAVKRNAAKTSTDMQENTWDRLRDSQRGAHDSSNLCISVQFLKDNAISVRTWQKVSQWPKRTVDRKISTNVELLGN